MRRNERGAILGIVLVLLVVLLLAASLAVWGLRSETAAAGSDRTARSLLDCAEIGLAWGKAYFSSNADAYSNYFKSNNLCVGAAGAFTTPKGAPAFPCPPFGNRNGTSSNTAYGGTPPTNYPGGFPFTNTVTLGNQQYEYTVGIYDNADETAGQQDYSLDEDNRAVVYSRCFDPTTKQTRTVSALVEAIVPLNSDYKGQAGLGFRNTGNAN
jgi:hypothetical protein